MGLGGLLSAMGDKLIELGTAAVLAGTVVKLFGTISGIGAGLAAIAGGVILKSIGTSVTAPGGNNDGTSASSTGSGYTAPKSYGGSSGFGNSGGTVVFEIAGQKLVGVLSNTLRQNRSLGGGLGLST
jgi:hypothetical protein